MCIKAYTFFILGNPYFMTTHIRKILFYLIIFSIGFIPLYGNPQLDDSAKLAVNHTDDSGLKQGLWIVYKDNQMVEKGNYLNDLKEGVWTSYFEDEVIKSEITYLAGEAKGLAKFYYKSGKLREEGNWQIDHWEGSYKYYLESGQLSYDWFYNNKGKREGEQIYYHANGKKMYEGLWKDGKTEGTLKVYDEGGYLIQEKTFNDGRIAKVENIDQNKSINTTAKFIGTGYHSIVNLSGQTEEKGFFVKGKLFDGEKYSYNENSDLTKTTSYKQGKIVGVQESNIKE